MGQKKNVDMATTETKVKVVKDPEQAQTQKKLAPVKAKRTRSRKYVATRSQVDKTKTYDPFAAVEMVKKLSYAKFDSTVEAHAVLNKVGVTASLTFPHLTGQTVRVAIVNQDLLKKIEKGEIEFDVLLSSPQFMPKLAKFARSLGPKGLMPNPKNGTLTDKPELKKKELEGGKVTFKTEKKAPLMHITLGKVSMNTKQLVENLNALIKALGDGLVKLSISASMSPGVKVELG